jgi:hypothetical protein
MSNVNLVLEKKEDQIKKKKVKGNMQEKVTEICHNEEERVHWR